MTSNSILEAAEKEIKRLEKEVEMLTEKLAKSEVNTQKYNQRLNDSNDRIHALKLEYGASYGGDGMFKVVQESLKVQTELNKVLLAENKELHKRCDAAFAGTKIEASAKMHMLQSITERLDGIKVSVDALKE